MKKNCQIRTLEHHKTLKMVGTHVQVNCFSEGRGFLFIKSRFSQLHVDWCV